MFSLVAHFACQRSIVEKDFFNSIHCPIAPSGREKEFSRGNGSGRIWILPGHQPPGPDSHDGESIFGWIHFGRVGICKQCLYEETQPNNVEVELNLVPTPLARPHNCPCGGQIPGLRPTMNTGNMVIGPGLRNHHHPPTRQLHQHSTSGQQRRPTPAPLEFTTVLMLALHLHSNLATNVNPPAHHKDSTLHKQYSHHKALVTQQCTLLSKRQYPGH